MKAYRITLIKVLLGSFLMLGWCSVVASRSLAGGFGAVLVGMLFGWARVSGPRGRTVRTWSVPVEGGRVVVRVYGPGRVTVGLSVDGQVAVSGYGDAVRGVDGVVVDGLGVGPGRGELWDNAATGARVVISTHVLGSWEQQILNYQYWIHVVLTYYVDGFELKYCMSNFNVGRKCLWYMNRKVRGDLDCS